MISNLQSSVSVEQFNDSQEQRNCSRLTPNVSVIWVITKSQAQKATFFDDSFGGIGLIMDMADAAEIQTGDEVIVMYYGCPVKGSVQWIDNVQKTPQVRMGIQWVKSAKG